MVNVMIHMKSGKTYECFFETNSTNTLDIIKEIRGKPQQGIYDKNWTGFMRKNDPEKGMLYILTNEIEAVEIY